LPEVAAKEKNRKKGETCGEKKEKCWCAREGAPERAVVTQ